ncbi:hypothetical protein ASE90_10355 [Sphingomonas sp. Leaf67]|uniref:hypothetical protein n=1 Tax=Sphingomonas sp. Leaf67 TaxID=1736230 RepID=UPI0007014A3A|nr:hypothetical protein [Sphingomonas sp. Leaf67]KQN82092.1 hypothetical protein ASE90_10355 [Sphingomonas sp. Leaf67]
MEKTSLTASIDIETAAIVQRLATARGQSIGDVAAALLHEAALSEERLLDAAQTGLDDLQHGRTIPHDVVMRELDAMIARHRARCQD